MLTSRPDVWRRLDVSRRRLHPDAPGPFAMVIRTVLTSVTGHVDRDRFPVALGARAGDQRHRRRRRGAGRTAGERVRR